LIRLEQGSTLAGRPQVWCDVFDTTIAVAVIGADVDSVVDAYGTQFAAASGHQVVVSSIEVHGDRITDVRTAGDGDWWSLEVVERKGEPTFGWLQSGPDT
jgi:hypothetical protein